MTWDNLSEELEELFDETATDTSNIVDWRFVVDDMGWSDRTQHRGTKTRKIKLSLRPLLKRTRKIQPYLPPAVWTKRTPEENAHAARLKRERYKKTRNPTRDYTCRACGAEGHNRRTCATQLRGGTMTETNTVKMVDAAELVKANKKTNDLRAINDELQTMMGDMPAVRAYLRETQDFHKKELKTFVDNVATLLKDVINPEAFKGDDDVAKSLQAMRASVEKMKEHLFRLHPAIKRTYDLETKIDVNTKANVP